MSAENHLKTSSNFVFQATTGPKDWSLTEFEDDWPYRLRTGDIYFSPSENQEPKKREPIIQYVKASQPADGGVFLVGAAVVLAMWLTRVPPPLAVESMASVEA